MPHYRVILVVLALLLMLSLSSRSRPGRFESGSAASSVSASVTGYVRIGGAVKHPGIYAISANKMAEDAIKMAEPVPGVATGVLAPIGVMQVVSGDSINVVILPNGKTSLVKGSIPVAERLVLGIPLDINSMNDVDFDRVPGIGPVMARRIVEYRQKNGGIMSKKDLLLVEGIGEKKFFSLGKYFK